MKRSAVRSILIAVVLLAVAVIAEAQQPKKVPRIGYLAPLDPDSESTRSEAIRLLMFCICAYDHLRFSLIRQLRSANRSDGHAIAAPQMLKGVFAESFIVE